jgi:uncharacterized NAD(P)/FAD-binding protein YdhS
MQDPPTVAIVGAGFSGSLLALHLLRAGPPNLRIFLIERTPGFGPGLAYGSHNPEHVLNVRVSNMSAWPEAPDHLQRWLDAQAGTGEAQASAFITRGTFGRYIAEMIQQTIAGPDGAQRLILVHDEAVGLARMADGLRLTLGMGRSLDLDAVVLAIGNQPPAPLKGLGLETLPLADYAPDPWAKGALDGLKVEEPVLLIGTGLTMVDIALALRSRGHRGPIQALSRRGLAPHCHAAVSPVQHPSPIAVDGPLSQLLRRVRGRARAIGWREAVDELRPSAQAIWRTADLQSRRRFLRHLRPWWDIHRHRMAPVVSDRVKAMREDGQLLLAAGRILSIEAARGELAVTWRARGSTDEQTIRVGRIINCTGPGGDPLNARNPLLRDLIGQGLARPDALGFGLDVDDEDHVVDATGLANPRLYAVGPMTKGAHWEIVAVPDIRNQVAGLAKSPGFGFWADAARRIS